MKYFMGFCATLNTEFRYFLGCRVVTSKPSYAKLCVENFVIDYANSFLNKHCVAILHDA